MSGVRPDIARHLPELRRYARMLAGAQSLGDWYVRACLEDILEDPARLAEAIDPRRALFSAFQDTWTFASPPVEVWSGAGGRERSLDSHIQALPDDNRKILLLTKLCGFSLPEAAEIADISLEQARFRLASALEALECQTATTALIIEDEPIIALDLSRIVMRMGHSVVGHADTQDGAVRMARDLRPGVILADIQLRGGGSGVDAAQEILPHVEAPIIFVTAFPERLLTGEGLEPTYMVTKPFDPDVLRLTIHQALLLHGEPAARRHA